jgi:hypothetical protein
MLPTSKSLHNTTLQSRAESRSPRDHGPLPQRTTLLLPARRANLKESLSHFSVALPGCTESPPTVSLRNRYEKGSVLRNSRLTPHGQPCAAQFAGKEHRMIASRIFAGLLIGLVTLALLYWTRRLKPQIAGAGAQRMCPFCGLITSRLKARCLECGKFLKP